MFKDSSLKLYSEAVAPLSSLMSSTFLDLHFRYLVLIDLVYFLYEKLLVTYWTCFSSRSSVKLFEIDMNKIRFRRVVFL